MTATVPTSAARRPRESDWRLLLKLVPYAKRCQGPLAIALVLLLPVSVASAVQPLLVGQAIAVLNEENTWALLQGKETFAAIRLVGAMLLGTILVRLVFAALQGYMVQRVGQEITASIRDDLFRHVTSLSSSFFDRTPVGKLVTRLTSDVEALGDVFSTGAVGIVSDVVSIGVFLGAAFFEQWQLALVLVALLVPIGVATVYFQKQLREANYRAREELSKLNTMLQENVAGINIVQLFRRERYNSKQFNQTNQRYLVQANRTIFNDSAVSATLEWISLVAVAAVLGIGGALVFGGSLELGSLTAFILIAQRLFEPLRQFADKFTLLQAGFTGIERITEILQQPVEIRDPDSDRRQQLAATAETERSGEIRFEDVWFAYKADDYVLKGLDLAIRPGEKVALVGPTGAGKSSIIRLLCRLYEPTKGRILVDGIDIRDLPQQELRRHIGVILQESFLFAGSVKDNITLGETYSFEEVKQAAKLTDIDSFVEQLPRGYDTELRSRGTNLSGGQRQLLAFARVAIRDPRVLVLDEATASLDVSTEVQIQAALGQLMRERTAIIIAHRLSTIRDVDRIFCLKRGEIAESGTHDELLARGGLYASLYKLQMLGGEAESTAIASGSS